MNKQHFTKLIKDPVSLKDDLHDLHKLQAEHPYCQSLHVLVALAHKQARTEKAGPTLNYAAMYVADRGNLKNLISEPEVLSKPPAKPPVEKKKEKLLKASIAEERKREKELSEDQKSSIHSEKHNKPITTPQPAVTKKQNLPAETDSALPAETSKPGQEKQDQASDKITYFTHTDHGEQLRDDLIKNLENLKLAKQRWADSEKVSPKSMTTGSETAKSSAGGTSKPSTKKATAKKKATVKKTVGKVKKKKSEPTEKKKIPKKSTKAAEAKKEKDIIKKPKQIAEKNKVKEQQELIKKFIEVSPSIKAKAANPPAVDPNQKDLSVPSTSFSDTLISENLAEIMVGQGKIEKAIDIYKKLIWKYPQKKAYFAARIDELNK